MSFFRSRLIIVVSKIHICFDIDFMGKSGVSRNMIFFSILSFSSPESNNI